MNVGASSNIHQSITSFFFFPGLEVLGRGGGRGREVEKEKGVWVLFTFFPGAKQRDSLR